MGWWKGQKETVGFLRIEWLVKELEDAEDLIGSQVQGKLFIFLASTPFFCGQFISPLSFIDQRWKSSLSSLVKRRGWGVQNREEEMRVEGDLAAWFCNNIHTHFWRCQKSDKGPLHHLFYTKSFLCFFFFLLLSLLNKQLLHCKKNLNKLLIPLSL